MLPNRNQMFKPPNFPWVYFEVRPNLPHYKTILFHDTKSAWMRRRPVILMRWREAFFVAPSSVTLPVKRILSKPHIGRSPSSNLHTNVTLSHSPVAGRSLLKVQRSSHKPLYESNHHIRVSPVTLKKPYRTQKYTNVIGLCALKAKPDLNTTLPVRQTASIFKQPVTKVTNHPNNKVKTDPQKAVDQPRQVRQGGEPPAVTVF